MPILPPSPVIGPLVQLGSNSPPGRIRQYLLTGGSRAAFLPRALLVAALAGLARRRRVVGDFPGVVILEAQGVDHPAGHQRQAEDVGPEQGDEQEAES